MALTNSPTNSMSTQIARYCLSFILTLTGTNSYFYSCPVKLPATHSYSYLLTTTHTLCQSLMLHLSPLKWVWSEYELVYSWVSMPTYGGGLEGVHGHNTQWIWIKKQQSQVDAPSCPTQVVLNGARKSSCLSLLAWVLCAQTLASCCANVRVPHQGAYSGVTGTNSTLWATTIDSFPSDSSRTPLRCDACNAGGSTPQHIADRVLFLLYSSSCLAICVTPTYHPSAFLEHSLRGFSATLNLTVTFNASLSGATAHFFF